MTDLAKTIAPRSDQLNADDLIAGSRTITVKEVRGREAPDQPIAIHFEGDDGKPYLPCKSMRRVMVHAWGPDGKTYAGRRMTLFCDPSVQFGGIKVGGIRISHLSHIDRDLVLSLTVTRAKRAPYTVKALRADVKGFEGQRQETTGDDFPADREREQPSGFGASAAGFTGWAAGQATLIDGFGSVRDLDAYSNRSDIGDQFRELSAEDPEQARKLEGKLRARRKVLLDRERG